MAASDGGMECTICFNTKDDVESRCTTPHCNNIICKSCYNGMKSCPFCRTTYQKDIETTTQFIMTYWRKHKRALCQCGEIANDDKIMTYHLMKTYAKRTTPNWRKLALALLENMDFVKLYFRLDKYETEYITDDLKKYVATK